VANHCKRIIHMRDGRIEGEETVPGRGPMPQSPVLSKDRIAQAGQVVSSCGFQVQS
jgi:hypothetical protein